MYIYEGGQNKMKRTYKIKVEWKSEEEEVYAESQEQALELGRLLASNQPKIKQVKIVGVK